MERFLGQMTEKDFVLKHSDKMLIKGVLKDRDFRFIKSNSLQLTDVNFPEKSVDMSQDRAMFSTNTLVDNAPQAPMIKHIDTRIKNQPQERKTFRAMVVKKTNHV